VKKKRVTNDHGAMPSSRHTFRQDLSLAEKKIKILSMGKVTPNSLSLKKGKKTDKKQQSSLGPEKKSQDINWEGKKKEQSLSP